MEMFVTSTAKQRELLEYCSCTAEVLRAEKNPRDAYRVQRNRPRNPTHCSRGLVETLAHACPLAMNKECSSMECTPDNKRPRSSVPEAAEEHCDHDVAVNKPPGAAVPAEWN